MKCPYNGFKECLVEKCPSCEYTAEKHTVIAGRWQPWMTTQQALENGNAWEETKTQYKFVSCKLLDNNVPVPDQTTIVNEQRVVNHQTAVVVKRGLINF